MLVDQRQGFLLIEVNVGGFPFVGKGGEGNGARAHGDGFLSKPGQIAQSQIGFHIGLEDLDEIVDFIQVGGGQSLLGGSLQKCLLGLHAAQILRGIAAAETNHFHGVFAVQGLQTLVNVDVQILIGIFVMHIHGDIEGNAADGIHHGGNGLEGYQFQYAGSDNLDEVAVWNTDVVSEIKTKKPNGLRIYDLNGNIEEWTFDRYKGIENVLYAGGYYFYKQPDAFLLSKSYASCMAISLTARNSQIGLRVVCTAD